jgi:hypothetical protein
METLLMVRFLVRYLGTETKDGSRFQGPHSHVLWWVNVAKRWFSDLHCEKTIDEIDYSMQYAVIPRSSIHLIINSKG